MTTTMVEFNLLDTAHPFALQRYRIGLIVRGMTAPGRRPSDEGHADCVLPFGAPVGFFAEGDRAAVATGRSAAAGTSGMSAADGVPGDVSAGSAVVIGAVTGMLAGRVYRYADFLRERPYYVSRETAIATGLRSTLLAIDVSDREARSFEQAWNTMRDDPGRFGIVGLNCATHAGWAFSCAGLLTTSAGSLGSRRTAEITGMDTPTELYRQLVAGPANARFTSYSGYLGFEPLSHGMFRVSVDSV